VSVRDDPVLFLQQGKGKTTGGSSVGGGSAITTTHVHRLNGPEHTLATDDDRLNATGGEPGLLPKLSGITTDTLHGDGTWAPGSSALVIKDEGTPLATFAASIDFVGPGVVATGTGADKTVTISEPAAATVAFDLAAHLADATDAHDASSISVLDTGALYTATDVEGALAEVMTAVVAAGAAIVAAAATAWAPIMANDPAIVTTGGVTVYIPLVTADGAAILGRVPV
jgi:hypothetical protein